VKPQFGFYHKLDHCATFRKCREPLVPIEVCNPSQFLLHLIKLVPMSKNEVKEQINKVLDNVPDEALESILNYLKELLKKSESELILSNNLNKILSEDKEVLEKLAK